MPRPKVERVSRAIRLPADLDAAVVKRAEAEGMSVQQAFEAMADEWTKAMKSYGRTMREVNRAASKAISPKPRQVEPRFKGKGKT